MSQILRDVHSLDLPNNPLDEIIYKVVSKNNLDFSIPVCNC